MAIARRRTARTRALLSLLLLAWSPLAGRTAAAADRPAAARPSSAQIEALRRWLCPNGGRVVRGAPGRCDGIRRARVPGGGPSGAPGGSSGGAESDPAVAGWFRDLPPARPGQAACPEGMRAVAVSGHVATVRCLPG